MDMVCIVCPNGCRLTVENNNGEISVAGAKCKRGEAFAKTELTCPTRSITSSVRTTVSDYPVVSVRTDGEIPKDKIFELIAILSKFTLDKKVFAHYNLAVPAGGEGPAARRMRMCWNW